MPDRIHLAVSGENSEHGIKMILMNFKSKCLFSRLENTSQNVGRYSICKFW